MTIGNVHAKPAVSTLSQGGKSRRRIMAMAAVATMGVSLSWAAQATEQAYPSKAVRMIIPFAPGGPTDMTARIIGDALSRKWGHPVVMENRAGAGGTVGAAAAAKANPDGYTLLLGVTGSHAIAGSLYESLPYDPKNDFEPVARAVIYPNAIVAHPSLPATSLEELIALAKADPTRFNYGSDGNGTASHLTLELLKERGKFQMQSIQYKGASPMLNDLIAGFIPLGITGLPSAEPFLKSGQLKLIALTTDKDYSGKGLPTIAEQGFPGFELAPWSGIFAPKGTPAAIVKQIAADIAEVTATDDIKQKMQNLGLQLMVNTPEQFASDLDAERVKWAEAVKISGTKVQ